MIASCKREFMVRLISITVFFTGGASPTASKVAVQRDDPGSEFISFQFFDCFRERMIFLPNLS
jgi:hypothetical protein